MTFPYSRKVCDECPWRRTAKVGEFTVEKFRALASTAEDMSARVFTCHKTPEGKPKACAGWLQQQGGHNLTVRMAALSGKIDFSTVEQRDDLHTSYREMAIAQGVDPDDPCLTRIRDDGQIGVGDDAGNW